METIVKRIEQPAALGTMTDARTDSQVVSMWLARVGTRSKNSLRVYKRNIEGFFRAVPKPLNRVTVEDLQRYQSELATTISGRTGEPLSPATQASAFVAIKSLFRFAMKVGHLHLNPTVCIDLPKPGDTRGERILSEQDVVRMIDAVEGRNRLLLRVLYIGALRVSEAVNLRWKDAQPSHDGGVLHVIGKGQKTRYVAIGPELWRDLEAVRRGAETPIFVSGKGGPLSTVQIWKITKRAGLKAGLDPKNLPSPHWFRHSHATHALERKESIHLVTATLGHSSMSTTSVYAHVRPGDGSGLRLIVK